MAKRKTFLLKHWLDRWQKQPFVEKLLVFFVVIVGLKTLVDPDFGWHLRAGADLLKNGWIAKTDPYSYTLSNWPWVDHEWLSNGILAFIYQYLGPFGLIFLFAILIAGSFILAASLTKLQLRYKLLASLLAILASLPILGVRVQMVTLLGMALTLWALYRYRQGELKQIWWLIPVMCLWANLHGGFLMGLTIMGVFFVGEGIKFLWQRYWPKLYQRIKISEPIFQPRQFRQLFFVGVGSAAATLINPYGWGLYYDFYKLFTTPFAIKSIAEWQPVVFSSITAQNYVVYIALFLLLFLLVYRRIEPTRWLLMGVFFYLSILYWRNLPFFMIVSVSLLAEIIYEHTHAVFDRVMSSRLGLTLITIAVAVIASQRLADVIPKTLDLEGTFRAGNYPIDAVKWAKANPDKLVTRMFNDYGQGGFLIWQFPEQKVFIDGRQPFWRTEDGRLLFADNLSILNAAPGSIEFMEDHYGVDWVFIRAGMPLDLALSGQDRWEILYRDRTGVIYRKKPADDAIDTTV